jgi:hypothetical protein
MPQQCITAETTSGSPAAGSEIFMCGNKPLLMKNTYATMPMVAVQLQPAHVYHLSDANDINEEELYTSFEQAISDRVTAMNCRLQRITRNTHLALGPSCPSPVQAQTRVASHPLQFTNRWQRILLLSSLAFMLLLLGFDLMGLLVLYLH